MALQPGALRSARFQKIEADLLVLKTMLAVVIVGVAALVIKALGEPRLRI